MGTRWTCGCGFGYVLGVKEDEGEELRGNDGIDTARRGRSMIFWGWMEDGAARLGFDVKLIVDHYMTNWTRMFILHAYCSSCGSRRTDRQTAWWFSPCHVGFRHVMLVLTTSSFLRWYKKSPGRTSAGWTIKHGRRSSPGSRGLRKQINARALKLELFRVAQDLGTS